MPELESALAADPARQALDAAAAFVARRPRSEREVRRRLAQKRFEPALIDETIGRLRELRLIDDAEFARTWAERRDRTSPRSRRLVAGELRARGVDGATAQEAASALSDADAAYRFAAHRMRSLAHAGDETFRARLSSTLRGRGIGWDVVRATVDRCWGDLHGDPAEDDAASTVQ